MDALDDISLAHVFSFVNYGDIALSIPLVSKRSNYVSSIIRSDFDKKYSILYDDKPIEECIVVCTASNDINILRHLTQEMERDGIVPWDRLSLIASYRNYDDIVGFCIEKGANKWSELMISSAYSGNCKRFYAFEEAYKNKESTFLEIIYRKCMISACHSNSEEILKHCSSLLRKPPWEKCMISCLSKGHLDLAEYCIASGNITLAKYFIKGGIFSCREGRLESYKLCEKRLHGIADFSVFAYSALINRKSEIFEYIIANHKVHWNYIAKGAVETNNFEFIKKFSDKISLNNTACHAAEVGNYDMVDFIDRLVPKTINWSDIIMFSCKKSEVPLRFIEYCSGKGPLEPEKMVAAAIYKNDYSLISLINQFNIFSYNFPMIAAIDIQNAELINDYLFYFESREIIDYLYYSVYYTKLNSFKSLLSRLEQSSFSALINYILMMDAKVFLSTFLEKFPGTKIDAKEAVKHEAINCLAFLKGHGSGSNWSQAYEIAMEKGDTKLIDVIKN